MHSLHRILGSALGSGSDPSSCQVARILYPSCCWGARILGPQRPRPRGQSAQYLQHTQQPKVQAWQPPSKKLIFKPFFFIGAAPCPHYGINAATLVGHGPHQARIQGDPIGSGLCGPGSKVGIRGACAQDPSLAHGRAAAPSSPPKIARILQRLLMASTRLGNYKAKHGLATKSCKWLAGG